MLNESRPLTRIRALLLALLPLVLIAPLALAQDEPGNEEEEFDPRVYLNTEEDADGLLRAAWRARENGNWRVAIDKYLETIREYGSTVFASNERLYLPMRKLVCRELSAMPKEGKAVYALIKGRESDMAYRRALSGSSVDDLREIAKNYPCLPAAPRALYLLGEWSRAQGLPGRALYYWQQLLVEYPEWEEASSTAVLTRAALVAAESGRVAEGQRLLAKLRKTGGLARLRVGNTEDLVADEVARRLKAAGSGSSATAVPDGGYWPTIGGSPAHDRCAPRVVDAGVRRWQKPLGTAARRNPRYYGRNQPTAPAASVAKRHPVCAGGMIFLAGNETVMAVRSMSGNQVWAASKSKVDTKLTCSRMTLPALGEDKVFVVQGNPAIRSNRFGRGQGTPRSNIKLRAYAIGGGKLRWESGSNESKKTLEFLSEVDLVSMPVYDSGYVYVPAVKRGSINDLYMCCFDAADGKLVWKTFVCAGYPLKTGYYYNATDVLEDALPPAIHEGLIAFVSNVGAVSVLDAASGQLLWVYLYDRIEPPKTGRFGRQRVTGIKSWAPSAPIIKDGLFICAPQDSPHLLAFDMASGKIRWRSRRSTLKHLVGISGNKLIASGGREVVCFSVRSGKRLWRGLLDDEEAGLGQVGPGFAVIPTRKSIQRFDLRTGKLANKFLFKNGATEAGNLLVSGDVMVSVNDKAFGGYYAWDEITAKLGDQIKTQPDAAKPRAQLAEVYFSAEKYVDAARIFKEALSRTKPDEKVDGVLLAPVLKRQIWESFSRLGTRAEKDSKFDGALARYQQAHEHAIDSHSKMVGHLRFARCRIQINEHAAAVVDYQKAIASYPREIYKHGKSRAAAGIFAKRAIDRLIKDQGREVYAPFDKKATEMLAAAATVKDVRHVIDVYPNSSSVSPALIRLSEIYTDGKQYADAAASLREHLFKQRGSPRELEVRARLALAYKGQEINGLARSVIRQMKRRYAAKSFSLASKEWSVEDFAAKHMPEVAGPGKALAAPDLAPPMITAWKLNAGPNMRIASNAGKFDVTGAAFVISAGRQIVAVDLNTGRKLWTKAGPPGVANRFMLTAVATSGSVLAANGNRMRALSPATGETLWEAKLYDILNANNARWYGAHTRMLAGDGIVVAIPSWHAYDPKTRRRSYKSRAVVMDETTGQQIWAKDFVSQTSLAKLTNGALLIAGYDSKRRKGRLIALDVADGNKRFEAQIDGYPRTLHTAGGLAAIGGGKHVYCYDLSTGKLKWRGSAGGNSQNIIAGDDSKILVLGQGKTLCAFDLENGKRLWQSAGLGSVRHGTTITNLQHQERIMLATYNRAKRAYTVVAIDTTTGKIAWKSPLPTQSYYHSGLMSKTHGMGLVRIRKGRSYVYERRTWNMKTGKLVSTAKAGGHGSLKIHEGTVLQTSHTQLECLLPGSKKAPQK